jgi:hypothetical protein
MVTAQERVGGFTDKWTALHRPFVGTCPSLVVRDAVDERFALKSTRRQYVQVDRGILTRLWVRICGASVVRSARHRMNG